MEWDPLIDELHEHARKNAPLPMTGAAPDWTSGTPADALHRAGLGDRRLYIASLNHAIWLHRAPMADAWLHFDCESPGALRGRGLSVGRVHDAQGRLVASVTQECLLAYAD